MPPLLDLVQVGAPVFIVTAVGYLWRRRALPFSQSFVTQFVSLVGAPALVFVTLLNSQFALPDIARMGGATLLCLLLFTAVAVPALKILGYEQRVYLPSLIFPNIGNMGLPICLYAFGERGLALAMIYFAITSIGQFTFGPAIARGRITLGAVLRAPFLYAAVAAVACSQAEVPFPDWILKTLKLIGDVTIPLMLLGLGCALAEFGARAWPRQTAFSLARIGLGFCGGLAVATLFGFSGAERGVLIIESSMPVAVFNYFFAREYGAHQEEVAGMVLISTVLSYVLLPGVLLIAL
ncbi:AEC family transporter [Rhodoblastus acidophilus]|uniref:AEC family transporter n=1 Tax=Rhodoblastus acidophilus TaxID=1074 RepID=A0A6N8DML8_RHOAC|nr:AEC family transporter [Rhodoblastus acidophilus]MCW2275338.1 putative permease [Rhodoblastus acidophilus]MTV31770.1 AEC family transporter [Rhodoblastus acidophilus]